MSSGESEVVVGPLTSALEELVCALCMGTFSTPRSLQCLHTYCQECLEGLLRVSARKDTVTCPECRVKTALQPGGVQGEQLASFA